MINQSPYKSRNQGVKISKTSKTFENFYEKQVEFQRHKLSRMQDSIDRKAQEEEDIRRLSNMKHFSANKKYEKVKSKYANYSKMKKVDQLLYDSTSRKKFVKPHSQISQQSENSLYNDAIRRRKRKRRCSSLF